MNACKAYAVQANIVATTLGCCRSYWGCRCLEHAGEVQMLSSTTLQLCFVWQYQCLSGLLSTPVCRQHGRPADTSSWSPAYQIPAARPQLTMLE